MQSFAYSFHTGFASLGLFNQGLIKIGGRSALDPGVKEWYKYHKQKLNKNINY